MVKINLLDLSDETLVHIFGFLDSTDLYHLSFVCIRLENIARDEFLWIYCDGRAMPNSKAKIAYCEENVNNKTRRMMLAGNGQSECVLGENFFNKAVVLKNLTVLALENQYLDGRKVPLRCYPEQLEELSLCRSFVTGFRDYFKSCCDNLKMLRVLKLDRGHWFESHSLIPISKLPSLEILSLYLCKKISDRDMSYISLAGRLGFKNLKILDVRFTSLGDEVLKSFYKHLHLSELYFQGYSKTYKLECTKRQLELLYGAPTRFHNYLDSFSDVDDTNPAAMIDLFGDTFTLTSMNIQKVSDVGVRGYSLLERDVSSDYVPPKSILYKRPYGNCRCGFVKADSFEPYPPSFGVPDITDVEMLRKQIAGLTRRKTTPNVYYLEPNRTLMNQDGSGPHDLEWLGRRDPINEMEILIYGHLSAQAIHEQDALSTNIIEVDFMTNEIRARDSMEGLPLPRHLPFARIFRREAQNLLRENDDVAPPAEPRHVINIPPLLNHIDLGKRKRRGDGVDLNDVKKVKVANEEKRELSDISVPGCSRDNAMDISSGSGGASVSDTISSANISHAGTSSSIEDNVKITKCEICSAKIDKSQQKCDKCEKSEPSTSGNSIPSRPQVQCVSCIVCNRQIEMYLHHIPEPNNAQVRFLCPTCMKRNDTAPESSDVRPYIITWGEKRCAKCNRYVSQMFYSKDAVVALAPSEWKCAGCSQDVATPSRNASTQTNDNEPNLRIVPGERQLNVHVLRIREHDRHVPALDRIIVSQLGGRRLINNVNNLITPLRYISLRGYDKVTDISLRYLNHLSLDLIDVTHTNVTKRGVQAFLTDNPNCRVIHESACKCGPELHF